MPLRTGSLLRSLAAVALIDVILIWQLHRVLLWHTRVVEGLLKMANVPWELGREMSLLPGISAVLLRTAYLDYHTHPLYPFGFCVLALACFLIGYRRWPPPLKPLLFLVPACLALTLVYLRTVSPSVSYTPEEFCAIWYRGEAYLWLLLPFIFAMGFFMLNVPFSMKIGWLGLLLIYSFAWSAVRLALALATFHCWGSMWMPLYYFAAGFLTDFLYIVAFYSMAMDRAAAFLARERASW
jgi:hypothetical protein